MAKVTKRTVDALKPGEIIWDAAVAGFAARRQKGEAVTYLVKFRTAEGRQRWHTIGRHGAPWTPETARAEARRILGEVVGGADPSGERQKKRREPTIAEVAARYLVEHVAAHNRPSTAAEVRRIVEKRITPGLDDIRIGALIRADVKAWHTAMAATPYEGNRALAYLSKLLSLVAKDWELRPDNLCTGIKRFPERKRERYFSDAELAQIGGTLAAAERDGSEHPSFALLVRLLAVTGMRLGEALALDWSDVDLPDRAIRLRDAKAGGRTVHLGAAAVAILDAIEDREGPVMARLTAPAAEHAWERLRQRAGIPDGRLHDLRHTAATFAALAGGNAFVVRDLLGHKTLAMTGRYVERAADMVRATADTVSNRVAAALNAGNAQPAEIVKLRERRG